MLRYRAHLFPLPCRGPAIPPRALPYPQLPLPFEIPGAQYLPLAWADVKGWSDDDHLAAYKNRMSMDRRPAARNLWYYRPDFGIRAKECRAKNLHRTRQNRRAIDRRKECSIASAIQHLAQSNLDRTELSALRLGVGDQEGAVCVGHGFQGRCVTSRNH